MLRIFQGWLPAWRKKPWPLLGFLLGITFGATFLSAAEFEKSAKPQRTANTRLICRILMPSKVWVSENTALRHFAVGPHQGTGAAMVVFPGRSENPASYENEGLAVAKWLQTLGIEVFVLEPQSGRTIFHEDALADLQRSMQIVRNHAKPWEVDTARIGVMGFGEGARWAIRLAYPAHDGHSQDTGEFKSVNYRPKVMVLGYASLSNPEPVDSTWPPLFLFHAKDDTLAPFALADDLAKAYRNQRLPLRFYAYAKGGHGFGLGRESDSTRAWPSACARWMREIGLTPNLVLEEEIP